MTRVLRRVPTARRRHNFAAARGSGGTADAHGLGPWPKGVRVRIPPSAPAPPASAVRLPVTRRRSRPAPGGRRSAVPLQERSPLKVEYIEETSVRKSLTFEIEPEVVDKEIADARPATTRSRVEAPRLPAGQDPARRHQAALPRSRSSRTSAEKLVNRVVHEELEGRGLRPLATPRVTELKIDENQPLTFQAVFETLPLVELPEYKGLRGRRRARPQVAEEDVDKEIDRLREEAARYDPVEGRPARERRLRRPRRQLHARRTGKPQARRERPGRGRAPTDNHKDLNDGARRACRPARPRTSRSSSRRRTTPPEACAGKTVDYTVTLKAIKTKVVPAADDEFAKDLGEFGILAELREHDARAPAGGRGAQGRPRGEERARRGPGASRPASRCRRRWSSAT